jgi:hypothetical protein
VAYQQRRAIFDIGSPEPHRLQIAACMCPWKEILLTEIKFA